ncbi:hypothetical protein CA12_20620 [Alienimonas californiensis]|uniref:Uncharacterized protein n=2 Tax=Alienimonas californiensis TaxID=2527989 RepID=A0A517P9C2_9PLAN|nr:hypothetical protein CA12_20620 [Alienimonas californiensis]
MLLCLLPATLGLTGCGEQPDNSRWEAVQNDPADGGSSAAQDESLNQERLDVPNEFPAVGDVRTASPD